MFFYLSGSTAQVCNSLGNYDWSCNLLTDVKNAFIKCAGRKKPKIAPRQP